MSSAGPRIVDVDTTGMLLYLPTAPETIDVLIDNYRVWTTSVDSGQDPQSVVRVTWPPALSERLQGAADVEVRTTPSLTSLGVVRARFSDVPGGPRLTDERGARLSVTKYGNLRAAFDSLDSQTIATYLDQAQLVIQALIRDCERPAFLDYGTLLGAVRDGRMIGHDLDIDIGYLSSAQNPAAAMLDSFFVERTLRRRHGWRIQRKDGGLLQVFFPQADGRRRNIDIFTAFFVDDVLYQVHDTAMHGVAGDIIPVSEVNLEGRPMPAPRRPDKLLSALYGPGWRVPDPSFSYEASAAQATLRQWFVGPRYERDQWARFYANKGRDLPTTETQFAQVVLRESTADRLIDVGCGNGRDAVFFAQEGRSVLGLDAVPLALNLTRALADEGGVSFATRRLNLNSLRHTLSAGALDTRTTGSSDVYARFLAHCLSPASLANFWRYSAMVLRGGGRAFLEFRTPEDRDRPKHFSGRRHRYISPDVVAGAAQRAGGKVVFTETGTGLAPLGKEDPHICRMVVEWT